MKKWLSLFFLIIILLVPNVQSIFSDLKDPYPPGQPTSGPGGSDYLHTGVKKSSYRWGPKQFWIFEPNSPKPESAPLIAFIHGYYAMFPFYYQTWINHIVKKGNIVVYPRYQMGFILGYWNYHKNAVNAIKDAINILNNGDHVKPEIDKFAVVGHSLGGGITVHIASVAEEKGLPLPKAIMPVDPFLAPYHEFDLNKIPNGIYMLVIVSQDDTVAGNESGNTIYYNTPQISITQKDYIIQVTDAYGSPDLEAGHHAPLCMPGYFSYTVDALDYYSTWKLFDALTDFAFYGINKEYCLGNTNKQRFMGYWSDGNPVKEMIVTDFP